MRATESYRVHQIISDGSELQRPQGSAPADPEEMNTSHCLPSKTTSSLRRLSSLLYTFLFGCFSMKMLIF